jgi:hypothetical protein
LQSGEVLIEDKQNVLLRTYIVDITCDLLGGGGDR